MPPVTLSLQTANSEHTEHFYLEDMTVDYSLMVLSVFLYRGPPIRVQAVFTPNQSVP